LPKGAKAVGAVDPKQHIEISLRIREKRGTPLDNESAMDLGATKISDRQYVRREEFAAKAGADPDDVAKVDDFAHQHGLNVKSVHLASRTVKLSGTVAAFRAAFGVTLKKVKKGRATYRMRTGSVLVPTELKDIIVGVHGLDNRPVARSHFRFKRITRRAVRRNLTSTGFAVTDLAKLYGFPTDLTGAGQCIAIIELNDVDSRGRMIAGYEPADLTTFFKRVGVTRPSIVSVSVDGGANKAGNQDADGEVVLDIEVAGAIAPGAKIAVYFAPNTTNGFIDAVKAAAHDSARKPSVIPSAMAARKIRTGPSSFSTG